MDRKTQLEKELQRLTDIIVRDYKPERVILFGSLARGTALHEWSDIDLAIIKQTCQRFLDRIGEVLQLTHPQVAFNVVVYTPQEVTQMTKSDNYFWVDEISKKGKVLYDPCRVSGSKENLSEKKAQQPLEIYRKDLAIQSQEKFEIPHYRCEPCHQRC